MSLPNWNLKDEVGEVGVYVGSIRVMILNENFNKD